MLPGWSVGGSPHDITHSICPSFLFPQSHQEQCHGCHCPHRKTLSLPGTDWRCSCLWRCWVTCMSRERGCHLPHLRASQISMIEALPFGDFIPPPQELSPPSPHPHPVPFPILFPTQSPLLSVAEKLHLSYIGREANRYWGMWGKHAWSQKYSATSKPRQGKVCLPPLATPRPYA